MGESSVNKEKLFGTFSILSPQYISVDFEEFSSISLENQLEKLLENIPIHLVIVLCRRHPDLYIYFLRYFQHSPKAKENPKSYLPLLCEWINKIPIQWIVMHIPQIKDAHYSVLLVRETFSYQTIIASDLYEHSLELDEIWHKYLELDNTMSDMSQQEAWSKLIEYRSSIVELNDLKLTNTLPLRKYMRTDKKILLKEMLFGITSWSKYNQFFNANITGYCQSKNINIDDLIIETVVKRKWDVSQKISILKKIKDQDKLKTALEQMTFQNEKELDEIKAFAKKSKIDFKTNPTNYIQSLKSLYNSNLSRSNSNESILSNRTSPSPRRITRCASLNKFDFSQMCTCTLSKIANGLPLDPKIYASKLDKYKEIEEIKPLFDLATEFSMVISYDNYCEEEEKVNVFIELVTKNGHTVIERVMELLGFDADKVVEIVWSNNVFKNDAINIAPHLFKLYTKRNWEIVIDYIKKCAQKIGTISTCTLLIDALNKAVPFINGVKLVEVANTFPIIKGILNVPTNEQGHLLSLIGNGSIDDAKLYIESKQLKQYFDLLVDEGKMLNEEETMKALLSGNIDRICLAVQTILLLPQSKKSGILLNLMNTIPGTNLQMLQLVFFLMSKNNMAYDNKIKILFILFNLSINGTDFNEIIKEPQSFIFDNINVKNVYDMITLSTLLNMSTDKALLNLMIKKMKSTNFDDYSEFISLLRKEKSKEPLITGLSTRFNDQNRIYFYEALGESEKAKELKIDQILVSKDFSDHSNESYKSNPSRMICDFYSEIKLQEKYGNQLHEMMKNVADCCKLSITKIREHIANFWLTDTLSAEIKPTESTFIESKYYIYKRDDEANVQKALFVLRSWSLKNALKWLIAFIYQEKPFRAKAKAFECLFTIADRNEIESVFTGKFEDLVAKQKAVYFCRILEMHNLPAKEEMFDKRRIEATIKELSKNLSNEGAALTIFEMMIEYSIKDEELAVNVFNALFKYNKYFLLTRIIGFLDATGLDKSKQMEELVIRLLSYPMQELIDKKPYLPAFKAHQMSVFRAILDVFSQSPFNVSKLYVDGELLPLPRVIELSAAKGWPNHAAELGSHVADIKCRQEILHVLIENHHYDLSFQFCFNEKEIFTFICDENRFVEDAAKLMLDETLAKFTSWLDRINNSDALQVVISTLRSQMRTVEADRIIRKLKNATVC